MKGISLVERHFEKAAALLVAVLICAYLAWDFTNPASVKMGANAAATPVQVNQLLAKQAETLEKKQKSTEVALQFDPFEAGTAKKSYLERLTQDIAPTPKIRRNAPSLAALMTPEERLGDTWYYEPQFAAPTMVSPVAWYGDALDPAANAKNEPLQKHLAAQSDTGNMDVIWTRPTARVDLKAIRAELAKGDKSATPPRLPSPPTWRNNAIYFIDVVFERQELNRDGTWSPPVTVPTMFGRPTFRDQKDLSVNSIFASLRGEKSIENEIRQPDFYPTLHNTGRAESRGKKPEAEGQPSTPVPAGDKKKMQELDKMKADLAELEKDLQAAGGEWDDEIARKEAEAKRKEKHGSSGDSGGGSGGGTGGGLKGGAGASGPPTGGSTQGNDKSKRKVLTEKVRVLRKKVKHAETELGIDSGKSVDAGNDKPAEKVAKEVDLDFIDVWTHDMTATLGKTYRYRCRIDIFNPFFGKKRQLVEAQKKLADIPAIATQWSEWSAPLRVPMKAMYFADSGAVGEPGAVATRQTASFNVYVLKNGLWQVIDPRQSFEPGQPLIFRLKEKTDGESGEGASREIDSGWFVVDIVDDPNAVPEKQRSSLPAVVLGRRDGSGIFEIRYPTRDRLDGDQVTLKGLVDEAKAPKPVAKSAG
jgi:hypothetical protein